MSFRPDRVMPAAVAAGFLLLLWDPPQAILHEAGRSLELAWHLHPWQWDIAAVGRLLVHLLLLTMAWRGVGGPILRWAGGAATTSRAAELLRFALGYAATGSLVLGLGSDGLSRVHLLEILYLLLGGAGVAGMIRQVPHLGAPGGAGVRADVARTPRRAYIAALAWIVPFLVAILLAPEGFWDAIILHLGVPTRWLEEGRIGDMTPFFSREPMLTSANNAMILAAGGEAVAHAANIVLGIAVVLAGGDLAAGLFGAVAALPAMALAATSPLLCLLAVHAGADVATALFGILALGRLVAAWPAWPARHPGRSRVRLAGVLVGCAVACKLTAVTLAVALVVVCAPRWRAWRTLLPGAIPALPWLIRSWWATGNPVYPLFDRQLGSFGWGDYSAQSYGEEMSRTFFQFSWGALGAGWFGGPERSRFAAGILGPGVALAGLVVWGLPRKRGTVALAVLWLAAAAAPWSLTAPVWRYFSAGLVLSAVLVAGFAVVPRLRWIPLAVVLAQAVWVPIAIDRMEWPWAFARGEETREAFYAARHANPSLDAVGFLSRRGRLGPRARVLACGDARTLLLPAWTRSVSYFETDSLVALARSTRSHDRLLIGLRQQGVRWLLLNVGESLRMKTWEGYGWEGAAPERKLAEFFSRHAELRFARSSAWVYEIRARAAGAFIPECYTVPVHNRAVALACATASRRALASADPVGAIRCGWAGVAADEKSGFAWAALGDALLDAGKPALTMGAYDRALRYGWRTTATYRNQAAAFLRSKMYPNALEALGYARDVDPEAEFLSDEMQEVEHAWRRDVKRLIR